MTLVWDQPNLLVFFFISRVGSLVVVFLRVLSSLSGSMCSSCGGTNLEKSL